ncbi:hypothetical protein GCM10011348_08990 [Marinobacterium nitratireducens]|uniref:Lipoprotein n=1 Tax=Marinobacterium nitratireducens TaxID=518897 RepID=A0A917Z9C0_9GAMM|nr:hypothetical protein GCM10011348_08990 [Marinobacterium nitratireducens]
MILEGPRGWNGGSISEFLHPLIPGIIDRFGPNWIRGVQMARRIWIVLAAVAVLAGCGNKGPLYLPDQAPQASEQQQ